MSPSPLHLGIGLRRPCLHSHVRRTRREALLAWSAHFLEKAPCIDPPVLLSMIYAGAVTARRDTTVGEVAVRSAVDGRDSL